MTQQFNEDIVVLNGNGEVVAQLRRGGDLFLGGNGANGDIVLRNSKGGGTIRLSGETGDVILGGNDQGGTIRLRTADGRETLRISSSNIIAGGHGVNGSISLYAEDNDRSDLRRVGTILLMSERATVQVGGGSRDGHIRVLDKDSKLVFHVDAESGQLNIGRGRDRKPTIQVVGDQGDIHVGGNGANGGIILRDYLGNDTIRLDGKEGDIILENADCAEEFDVREDCDAEPGSVMVLNDDHKLKLCDTAYDKKVVGVVSGAKGYKPGIILDRQSSKLQRKPIALLGKVFCKVAATYHPIEVGDLLTTSQTPGYAMAAHDPNKAFGAVIGKALASMKTGLGSIPILVNLQ